MHFWWQNVQGVHESSGLRAGFTGTMTTGSFSGRSTVDRIERPRIRRHSFDARGPITAITRSRSSVLSTTKTR